MDKKIANSGTAAKEPVTDHPDYLSAAQAAYDAGFNPIPILPGTKRPARKWKKRDKPIRDTFIAINKRRDLKYFMYIFNFRVIIIQ